MTVAPARSYDRSDWASSFVNVEQELTDVALTPVRGAVPTELQGTFYRNGPGRLERDGHRVHHPFDGDGMIAAMRFAVSYTHLRAHETSAHLVCRLLLGKKNT